MSKEPCITHRLRTWAESDHEEDADLLSEFQGMCDIIDAEHFETLREVNRLQLRVESLRNQVDRLRGQVGNVVRIC